MEEDKPKDETQTASEDNGNGIEETEAGRRGGEEHQESSRGREETKTSASERTAEGDPAGENPGSGFMPDNRTLLLVAGGALGAVAVLSFGSIFDKIRPLAVAAVKEGYGFAEWLAGKVEGAKEDIEDIVAEGVHNHHAERAAAVEAAEREKELSEAMERIVERRVRGARSDKRREAS